jgi:nicotinamide phosphoribosyltransferase
MKENLKLPATLLCDFYKISHRKQYPANTEKIYSTWTPRMTRIKGVDKIVAFGFQGFIKNYLINYFDENFFKRPLEDVINEYKRAIKYTLNDPDPDASHLEALHKLGYLPIKISAVKEGTRVNIRTPMLTIENTKPEFFWLTNYLETLMSSCLWQPTTSATIAYKYRKMLNDYANETNGDLSGVKFQGHDFSFRGMGGVESAVSSGAGHLTSFVGTDTIPAILYHENYYNANIEKELVGCSIPATEHSVMCAYGRNELESYRHIITEVYPKGFASIVSDTWDLWSVLYDVIGKLKPEIINRDGRIVIRPDSGNPVDIVCGTVQIYDLDKENYIKTLDDCKKWMEETLIDELRTNTPHGECGKSEVSGVFKFNNINYEIVFDVDWNRYDKQYYYIYTYNLARCNEIKLKSEQKGVIEILWEIFGGTITAQGYKQLDTHIGCIYGDAITLDRCKEICDRLKAKGFASTNMVYGIGSYTYQYNTRDTFGFALKSTYGIFGSEEKNLYKDPITDSGFKKSATGKVCVYRNGDDILYRDGLSQEEYDKATDNLLEPIFEDGKLLREQSLAEIRALLHKNF